MSHTYLGNRELHKRHAVMVEGGNVPRARVVDQTVIDRYLMDGLIDIHEFRAGEYMLEQAMLSQMWAKGANLASAGGGDAGPRIPISAHRFGNPMRSVQKRFGDYHAQLLGKVILSNYDASKDPSTLLCLRQSLRHISEAWLGNKDPLRLLKRV